MSGYTVIDVETTGLSPGRGDRVVEVGVVYVSDAGEIQNSWSTLVNPQRDVGPTRIHGIRASDVLHAPTFGQLIPHLVRAVAGRTLVAHNAPFDLRFLAYEFDRAGLPLAPLPLSGVCTMQWSSAFLKAPSRRLVDCCAATGIELSEAHSAEADARATASLLTHYLKGSGFQPPWQDVLDSASGYAWPPTDDSSPSVAITPRVERAPAALDHWLTSIVSRMPRAAQPGTDSYLAVLESALLDGFLAEHEKEALVEAAIAAGHTRADVFVIHRAYLAAMAEVAWEDHVVTEAERSEMHRVAALLGLARAQVKDALEAAARGGDVTRPAAQAMTTSGIALAAGDRVAFTGDLVTPREQWITRCRDLELDPGGITRAARVLVAGDPNSSSGKANKARNYNVPIITEAAFSGLVRRMEENLT